MNQPSSKDPFSRLPPPNRMRASLLLLCSSAPGFCALYSHSSRTYIQDEPCAQVTNALTKSTFISADEALACLQSVPLDVDGGVQQILGLKAFLQYQSNLAYLSNPPSGYGCPGVNLTAALDDASHQLQTGSFSREYDFQLRLYEIVASACDGHLIYWPDITQVFSFHRAGSLYSISSDGVSLPKVYYDFLENTLVVQSPVVQIDNQDIQDFLRNATLPKQGFHDSDAAYNALFPNGPTNARYAGAGDDFTFYDFFRSPPTYPGAFTCIAFENGTRINVTNTATTYQNFTAVSDGASFFSKFCNRTVKVTGVPASLGSSPTYASPAAFTPIPSQASLPPPSGCPTPLALATDYSVGAYFPKSKPDLAVLSLPSFIPNDTSSFQNIVRGLLATSYARNKSKLIVDLRGNSGGNTYLPHGIFRQLFPSKMPKSNTNLRSHPMLDDFGRVVSNSSEVSTAVSNYSTSQLFYTPFYDVFNVENSVPLNGSAFTWDEFYGPLPRYGDNFTQPNYWNLSSPLVVSFPLFGFGNLSDNINPVQVFKPENILLLQDGLCASACSLFAEFMKSQGGVKSIVFGGRPENGPMQAVGGVKGADERYFESLWSEMQQVIANFSSPEQSQTSNETYGDVLNGPMRQALKRILNTSYGSLNLRNNIRVDDLLQTPLQFVYEAADCRLFYTAKQYFQAEEVWKAAYDAWWGNGSCVAGSTNDPSAAVLTGQPEADAQD